MASEETAFKRWFDRAAAKKLAAQMRRELPSFDEAKFIRRASRGLRDLEFAGRVQQFSDALRETLPKSIPRALAILANSMPDPLPDCEEVTDGYLQWPVGQFIADHGVPHFEESMTAMIALTQRFSSEFAVRPFVDQRPTETFERLMSLTDHVSPHVRRWCSEGTRPRLPWGKKLRALVADPGPIWPILEALKDDDVRYVTRSVANNVNDIAKDHPKAVVARCRQWARGASAERTWLVKHALRTRIKAGDPAALRIIGFGPPKKLDAKVSITPKSIAIGESVTMALALTSRHTRKQDVLIDYIVHFVRKNGDSNGKVFKWTKTSIGPGEKLDLKKRHAMRKTTIRALYPGAHRVEVQVNGACVADASFRLA